MSTAPAPTYTSISLDIADGLARLTLNRPDARNALTLDMGKELVDAITRIGESDARAVLLTGAGDHFSVGADLKSPPTGAPLTENDRPDLGWVLREVYNPIVRGLRDIPQPVVAGVRGSVVGVAIAFALASDIVVAADDTYFFSSFVKIGLVPDGGGTALVPARAGYARAAQMLLLGEKVTADTALAWGLVNEVLPAGEAAARAEAVAVQLSKGPKTAQAAIKHMLGATFGEELEAAFEAEAVAQRVQADGPEFIEGAMAFLQKREPNFGDL